MDGISLIPRVFAPCKDNFCFVTANDKRWGELGLGNEARIMSALYSTHHM